MTLRRSPLRTKASCSSALRNTLYYPQPKDGQNPRINSFRAYFQLSNGNDGVRKFKLNFGDGEASGITITDLVDKAGAWFTINGVKLGGKPTKAGLYIHGGHKVVIK